jgi:hypothetical protein
MGEYIRDNRKHPTPHNNPQEGHMSDTTTTTTTDLVYAGITARDIAREYFPDATDEECEYLIWERTGYPSFWDIPKDGLTPAECFRKQLRDAQNKMVRQDQGEGRD